MKKWIVLLLAISTNLSAQNNPPAFKTGEYLKFQISYGLIKAGIATMEVKKANRNNKEYYFVHGQGETTGMTHFFFPVKDIYQTYFDSLHHQPYNFVRKINEGGHKKDKEIYFDFEKNQAKVINHKKKWEKEFSVQSNVQDMISAFYYLRTINFDHYKAGDTIALDVFFDEETYHLKLLIEGREIIKTKLGKIKTIVVKPMVQKGRVFKEEESVTFWVTDDDNKIPVLIKAKILVGALKAELQEYKQLANPFPIIFN